MRLSLSLVQSLMSKGQLTALLVMTASLVRATACQRVWHLRTQHTQPQVQNRQKHTMICPMRLRAQTTRDQ